MYSTCMLYRACVYRLVRSPTRSLTRCRCTRYTAARAARPSTSGMQRPANDEPRTLRAPNTEFCPQDRQSLSVSYRCGAHMTLCNGVYCTTRPSTRPAPTTPSDRRIRRIRQPPSAQRSEQQILQLDPQLLGLTHLHSVTAVRSVVPEHLANLGVPLCPFAEIDHVRASPSRKYQVLRLERHLAPFEHHVISLRLLIIRLQFAVAPVQLRLARQVGHFDAHRLEEVGVLDGQMLAIVELYRITLRCVVVVLHLAQLPVVLRLPFEPTHRNLGPNR
mmetsp:Transcript_29959/g.67758  ORF Transcript_29959/g.67758 Transcript_29959/m.67758 type:complete len:275 (-) Transcript_29959:56-880(-)